MHARFASIRLITIGFASLSAVTPAWAQSATEPMDIEATVVAGCQISATTMNFGSLFGLTGRPTTTSTISLLCSPNTDYAISIDAGLYPSGARNRRMYNPSTNRYMRYNIYRNANFTGIWDTRNNRKVSGNSGATGVANHTAYGQIRNLAPADAGAGVFADTVTVTIEF
ncbi:spore coat U domain-containing protein [Pontixanthobacter aestiaquae]|uniref:Fimbrial major subunit CsuA/B family protein n=1 Tax=Pontixanthobacter aestiaquae TaxID=1509367 RepID=A0A844Z4U1_9SPHN|nr:spore coat U domain-containing protein [Pontixanthobacter aestiaquae]MDN3646901.1 spore coat U domain-containing protein [Pontixanthobacter aestiaquae]MXO82117.1 fimbrial major subunit CsuA/B family protein [Pontixanthobacter aestiaquae]